MGQKVISNAFVHQDVKLTASNDDYYFVFEDFLYQVMFSLCLRSALVSISFSFEVRR